jgi:phenylalanyl-tRNA synthetase beta chain
VKLPISWLADWIDVEGSPERVADALTRRGFYVEGIERHGRLYPGVVVARVLEVRKHPNADKLTLCRVDGGAGELSVVCGAPNVHADMIAPLATVGATLPGGITIKQSKIRGETSQGMLCSARELELSDDHQGILDLAAFCPGTTLPAPGTPLDALMPPPDAVLEVETPFNRPDGLGVLGLAREARAALGGRWTRQALERLERRWSGGEGFDLVLEDAEGCPRYIAQTIEGIVVQPSPPSWGRRLEALGQRPINNIVDATNLVLFELGQPLHAFDLDRLEGPAIRVRRAREQESLTTLDAKSRTLGPEVLVIADKQRPVAIAGVMGGADSEVAAGTRRLLLECAWFEPRRVRRGSRFLGLATEASKRFERGVDPEVGPIATARFLELLRESCPELSLGDALERVTSRPSLRRVRVRTSRIARVAGLTIAPADAARHLEALEFDVTPGDPLQVTVPSWRPDVTIEDDLVEEVARSVGYDAIPEARLETGGTYATRSPGERTVTRARSAMLARGLHEAWCTTLVSEREAMAAVTLLGDTPEALVRLRNPLSRESEVLRPNLAPGLLRACAHNLRQGRAAVRLFEVGIGFTAGAPLPQETLMLAAVVAGPRLRHAHTDARVSAVDSSLQAADFAAAKGLWEAWLEEMRVDSPQWRAYSGLGWKPGASAEVASGTSRIGWAGTLAPSLLREWGIETPVQLFVALLDPVQKATRAPSFHLPGKFPPVRRDLAFFVPQGVTHAALEQSLVRAAGERLESIELFDVYAGPGTPEGMKSMAYALQYQHPEHTMTEPEVQAIQDRIVAAVAREWGGRLRER